MPSRNAFDLRQQVGQLLIMGFDGTDVSARLRSMLGTLNPGGIILFRRNIEEAAQTHALLRQAQHVIAAPMFLCVDMEATTEDLLVRETDSEKLRLDGAKKIHNPSLPPNAALKLSIRIGRNGDQYVAHLDREHPMPGSETLEADSLETLAGSVMDRLHRLALSR